MQPQYARETQHSHSGLLDTTVEETGQEQGGSSSGNGTPANAGSTRTGTNKATTTSSASRTMLNDYPPPGALWDNKIDLVSARGAANKDHDKRDTSPTKMNISTSTSSNTRLFTSGKNAAAGTNVTVSTTGSMSSSAADASTTGVSTSSNNNNITATIPPLGWRRRTGSLAVVDPPSQLPLDSSLGETVLPIPVRRSVQHPHSADSVRGNPLHSSWNSMSTSYHNYSSSYQPGQYNYSGGPGSFYPYQQPHPHQHHYKRRGSS
ncbi:unnamed protein product, partial [Amoebophrya sp. A25]|eukprot:GSA25T00001261001.1